VVVSHQAERLVADHQAGVVVSHQAERLEADHQAGVVVSHQAESACRPAVNREGELITVLSKSFRLLSKPVQALSAI